MCVAQGVKCRKSSIIGGMDTYRVMLLTTSHTYRAPAFMAAAEKLGIEVVQAVDLPPELARQTSGVLGMPFDDIDTAVATITQFAQTTPLHAVLAVDDSGTLLAARASAALGLAHNDPGAAEAARNKWVMRQRLQEGGVPVPHFRRFHTDDDFGEVAQQVVYPCVVKPLTLSGSRGVMRVNNPAEFVQAARRLARLLARTASGPQPFLVEDYIPGVEVALEGMLNNGRLTTLALFDKPDPLEGPFFEETIYVTPSRLPQPVQQAIAAVSQQSAAALGLRHGPIHAELRVNDDGPWLVEAAGRSIGGLCGQTLRFDAGASLEELILRQAVGMPLPAVPADREASGVMMIPIPEAGLLKGVSGVAAAEAMPLIEGVEITAPLHNLLTPLPEGESYLGFIFARGETAVAVEAALRAAHACLHFEIAPQLVMI